MIFDELSLTRGSIFFFFCKSQAVPEGLLLLKSALHFSLQDMGTRSESILVQREGPQGPGGDIDTHASSGNTTSRESTLPAGSLGVRGGLRRWVGDGVMGIIRALGITGASEESSSLGPRDRILITPRTNPSGALGKVGGESLPWKVDPALNGTFHLQVPSPHRA